MYSVPMYQLSFWKTVGINVPTNCGQYKQNVITPIPEINMASRQLVRVYP